MTSDEFNTIRKKAEKEEDSKAMLDLALAYGDGDGVEPNKGAFFVWVKRSADAGEPEAAYELAYAYKNGIGTESNHALFIERLHEAAEDLEFPRALYELAILYKDGEIFDTDEERFFDLMKRAANKKVTTDKEDTAINEDIGNARLELAFAFRDNIGTKRSLASYRSWLEKAAELGNSEAMYHLAFEYYHPSDTKKMEEFIYWLSRAAEEGQPDALYHLAISYLNGEGVTKSRGRYFTLMKKAAETKSEAMFHLAISYLTANTPNFDNFSLWIKRALEAGQPGAFIASGLDDLRKESRIPHKTLIELYQDLKELYKTVLVIKRDHRVKKNKAINEVAHFTGFKTLKSMLPDRPASGRTTNRLWLYNFAYMNDPKEGKTLLDKKFDEGESLREFFSGDENTDNPLSWEEHDSSVYIGSFTLIGDDLQMWRTTYGNDGQGYCIITPWNAFDQGTRDEIRRDDEVINVSQGALEATEYLPLKLYEVRYTDTAVRKTLSSLKSSLDKVFKTRERLRNATKKRERMGNTTKKLDRIVRQIVSHILYLYKGEPYHTEYEARLIADYDISFKGLEFNEKEEPSRLYVETSDEFLFQKGSRIIIGPKVQQHTIAELDLKLRLARHNLHRKTKVMGSKLRGIYR
jgi:TPR repeat protein